ncbi:MAG: hypothetical protein HQL53_06605 [Magnetococcales bacterium]|nr:hypothetical protein [Magnetococcales bacterium]
MNFDALVALLHEGVGDVNNDNHIEGYAKIRHAYENGIRVAGNRLIDSMFFYYGIHDKLIENYESQIKEGFFPPKESVALQQEKIKEGFPSIALVTLPKSGSAYIANKMSKMFNLYQLLISFRAFPYDYIIPGLADIFAKGGLIYWSHLDASPHNLETLYQANIRKIHLHIRDPRQATLSWAHHLEKETIGISFIERFYTSPFIPEHYHTWPFERKLDWQIRTFLPQSIHWILEWLNIAEHDDRFDVQISEFAQLKNNPDAVLHNIVTFYAFPTKLEHNFDYSTKKGKDHYRKGELNEWMDVFTEQQIRVAEDLVPDKLKKRFSWT